VPHPRFHVLKLDGNCDLLSWKVGLGKMSQWLKGTHRSCKRPGLVPSTSMHNQHTHTHTHTHTTHTFFFNFLKESDFYYGI